MNGERRDASGAIQRGSGTVAPRSVMSRSNRGPSVPRKRTVPRKVNSMFRKVAIALVAASMLTAPVMVQAATSKPATTSSTAVKTVKADTTAVKHKKHVRAHHRARVAHHKHMNGVRHARHFNMNGTKH